VPDRCEKLKSVIRPDSIASRAPPAPSAPPRDPGSRGVICDARYDIVPSIVGDREPAIDIAPRSSLSTLATYGCRNSVATPVYEAGGDELPAQRGDRVGQRRRRVRVSEST